MQRSSHAGLTFTLAALLCAPAPGHGQGQQTPPDVALARLERQVSANPNSVKALRAAGVKYYEFQRFSEARTVLDHARQLAPRDALSALYSGMSSEGLKDFSAARVAYTKYLEVGKTKRVKDDIRARLVSMAKDELKQQAKAAVANETALGGQQGPPNTVAVLPFRYTGSDTSMIPLERGMADLVVTDLSKSGQLRVLERDRMQAIVDELALSRTASVDVATATRTGKLIAAGRILNGSIGSGGGANLTLTGAVVNSTSAVVDGNPVANGTIDRIFDLEKDFVLAVFRSLNITLTPAEQREFAKRPTQNLQAFLAYSRGLMAEDAGRLDDAIRFFESARSQDPGFSAALTRAQSAAAAQAGAQVSGAKVEQGLRNSAEGQVVAAAKGGSTSDATLNLTLNSVVGDVNPTTTNTVQNSTGGTTSGSNNTPTTQNQVAQTTGTNQPATRTGQVTIVIKKPGTP